MIETKVFKVDRGVFARLLFERHGQGWLFAGAFLVIVSLIFGFLLDYRIFILAFIVLCLVAPAMMMILYYNYGMKGENYLNVLDHRLEIEKDKLTVWLRVKEVPEEETEERFLEDEETAQEEVWRKSVWPLSSFGLYTVGKDYVIFPFRTEGTGFLYLPREAFGSDEEFADAVKIMAGGAEEGRLGSQESTEDNTDENNKR